jgi:hypothetical protein
MVGAGQLRTPREILDLYGERRKKKDPWALTASRVKEVYNSEFVLPLPEMDRNESPAIANLIYQGIEQFAMRIASTMPNVIYPSMRPGFQIHDENARDRRLVNLAWWDKNHLQLKLQKRARHFVAYAATPVMMRPDFSTSCPYWNVRDPLTTFPADMPPGEVYPDDCIFAFKRTLGWLKARYPVQAMRLNRKSREPNDLESFDVLEYTAADEYVLVAVGEAYAPYETNPNPDGQAVELERIPNRIGRCWATVPSRITLDRAKGQFDGVLGAYVTQAMLMALEVIGMKKAVFAEEWLESTVQGETGTIVVPANPMQGIVGVTKDGKVQVHRVDPSVLTTQIVDRLERNIRVETSMPAELGGEGGGNIRTGRRGDAIMAASVDFPVQMAQQIFEKTLQCENEIAVAIDKEYFPRKKSFVTSATKGKIEYTAKELWGEDGSETNFVAYSHAGTDVNSLVVAGLQRVGSGTLSKRGFMLMDPMIDDAEGMHDEIQYEALETAMLTSLQTRAAEDPTFAPVVAEVALKILQDKISVFEAYKIVDQQMKEQQAGLQAPQTPQEAAAQGQPGAAQPMAGINPPGPSQENLTQLLTSLKAGSRAVA